MASSADSWTENKEGPAEAETTYRALPSDSIVIIGGDADLVVQCLALPYTSNLFVYNPQNITHSKNVRGTNASCFGFFSIMRVMAHVECIHGFVRVLSVGKFRYSYVISRCVLEQMRTSFLCSLVL